jgi:hypothetical protein
MKILMLRLTGPPEVALVLKLQLRQVLGQNWITSIDLVGSEIAVRGQRTAMEVKVSGCQQGLTVQRSRDVTRSQHVGGWSLIFEGTWRHEIIPNGLSKYRSTTVCR